MSKHTEGKWTIDGNSGQVIARVGDYEIVGKMGSFNEVNSEANAILISKSPELLEMLIKLTAAYITHCDKPSTKLLLESQYLINQFK